MNKLKIEDVSPSKDTRVGSPPSIGESGFKVENAFTREDFADFDQVFDPSNVFHVARKNAETILSDMNLTPATQPDLYLRELESEIARLSKEQQKKFQQLVRKQSGSKEPRGRSPRKSKSPSKADEQERFQKAIRKASSVRRRQLGRELEHDEWIQLRNAVRKQCSNVKTDDFTKRLSVLETRLSRLESGTYANDPGVQIADKISIFQLQLDIARRQMLELINDQASISEGCSHLAKKVVIKTTEPFEVQIKGPGIVGYCNVPSGSHRSCCDRCLSDRRDFIFESLGLETSPFRAGDSIDSVDHLNTTLYRGDKVPNFLEGVDPMRFQHIWSLFLDKKFGR